MYIKTSHPEDIAPFIKKLWRPAPISHKGQNSRVLIIGGSHLFHAASLWAAEIASHFTDMVHYSSTEENNEIFSHLKTVFRNGIIVHKQDIPSYVEEDDAILVGPGMVRTEKGITDFTPKEFDEISKMTEEGEYTSHLTYFLLKKYPHKRFVLDAGALQMMNPEWLRDRDEKVIISPHQEEFHRLFGEDLMKLETIEEKAEVVKRKASEYHCVILLKAIDDVVSDGEELYIVRGGNQGLTKGGSGDILAGLVVSLVAKNDPMTACVFASYAEKKAAEELAVTKSYWYNMSDLIQKIPEVFQKTSL